MDISGATHIILIVLGMAFSAGVTWGLMSSRQKNSEDKQKTSDDKVNSVVDDLKKIVHKLESLTTTLEVMKANTSRFEKDSEDHEKRIGALEVAIAKIGRNRRKSC